MSSRKTTTLAVAWRLLAAAFALLAAAEALAAPGGFQRMVMAPGCYQIAAGKSVEVPAYCLDQALAPPAAGAVLENAPAAYGAALVKTAAGRGLTLQAALAQHLLQVEGAGDDTHVRLKNLTPAAIEICITAPTVIMANGNYALGDLPKLYQQIQRILAPAEGATEHALHAAQQQALWEAVNEATGRSAEEDAYKALSRRILFGTVESPGPPAPSGTAPGGAKCSGTSSSVEICTDH